MEKHIRIQSEADLPQFIDTFLAFANGRKKIMLYGEIGAGKTTFVKAFCKKMQTDETANSPTFSIINEYEYPKGLIYHIDLYRLKTLEEALDIGIEDYLYDNNFCFIEWAELIENILPDDIITIHFETQDDESRSLSMKYKV
ncbi:MAG: tRNA (adenosine(37)-N6)-threonylcarbamoyltransferase complex ATPase subunit type 1 TsaE [Saprospiraceae bacterium]